MTRCPNREHAVDRRPAPADRTGDVRPDLSQVTFSDGNVLHFTEESERASLVDLFVIRSAYRQPFGTFTGTLPGGLAVTRGYGVMEEHRALW